MTTIKRPQLKRFHLTFVLLGLILIFSLLTPLALIPDGRSVLLTGHPLLNYPPSYLAAPSVIPTGSPTHLTHMEWDRHLLRPASPGYFKVQPLPEKDEPTRWRMRPIVQRVYKKTIIRRLF